jgi:hypothetical protein
VATRKNWILQAWESLIANSPNTVKERGEGYLMAIFVVVLENIMRAYPERIADVARADLKAFRLSKGDRIIAAAKREKGKA